MNEHIFHTENNSGYNFRWKTIRSTLIDMVSMLTSLMKLTIRLVECTLKDHSRKGVDTDTGKHLDQEVPLTSLGNQCDDDH